MSRTNLLVGEGFRQYTLYTHTKLVSSWDSDFISSQIIQSFPVCRSLGSIIKSPRMNIDQFLSAIHEEESRNLAFLHLTANENQLSNTARQFLGSKIAERYYMGAGENEVVDFGHFTALGFKGVSDLIAAANQAARDMLGAASVNLNVLSGVHAMMSAILSTTNPGDTVMTVPLESGGHFATKSIIDVIGRKHLYADYDYPNLRFDVDKIAKKFIDNHARALYLDVSYYLNPII